MGPNLLSLDGGGVRGIMTATVLEELESLAGQPLVDLFEYQIASSTGTLIQGARNHTFSYRQIIDLYKEKAKDIFHRTIWNKITNPEGLFGAEYSDVGIDALLKNDFGDTPLGKFRGRHLYFTAFKLDRIFVAFNNQENPDMLLREAIRACTAAPAYFTPEDQYVDGGIGFNNPSLLGCSFMAKAGVSPKTVVSIGTGKVKSSIDIGKSGILKVVPQLPDLFMSAEMAATDLAMQNFLGKKYYRIEFSITAEEDSMDNTDPRNLETLEKIAEVYIDDHKEELKEIVKQLK